MSDKHYEFEVKMACGGCSGAVERVLKKLDGVKSYSTDLATQKVQVTTADTVDFATVEATIKKTGKEVVSGREVTA